MTALTFYLLMFLVIGIGFVFIHLMLGRLIRPIRPDPDKLTIYECGEPTIGSAWIQFDLRYYVVALLFVIFDVEVAFFFPWAVVFGKANALADTRIEASQRLELSRELTNRRGPIGLEQTRPEQRPIQPPEAHELATVAFWDILIFFGVLLVGFAYLWRRGDLDWVRSLSAEETAETKGPVPASKPIPARDLVAAGSDSW